MQKQSNLKNECKSLINKILPLLLPSSSKNKILNSNNYFMKKDYCHSENKFNIFSIKMNHQPGVLKIQNTATGGTHAQAWQAGSIFKIAACLLLLFSTLFAQAQTTGTISGKVTDTKGNPLNAVNISIEGSSKGAATNANGSFRIENLAPGTYTLNITALGYRSQNVTLTVAAGQTASVPVVRLESQSQELDEVVVNANKNRYLDEIPSNSLRQITPIQELPQNIQVISGAVLKDQQLTSIMESISRNVSGVTMVEHWGFHPRINMRGFKLPSFRNGFNVSDSWGPLAEDMAIVDRIEFVKGPAGFMLTAGEPGGFYNVVTKKPTSQKIASASVMAGSFDLYRASMDVGGKLSENGKLLYRFNGVYHTQDTHRGGEDARRFIIAPSLTYRFSKRTSLNAEWNYQQARNLIGAAYVFVPKDKKFGSLPRNFKSIDPNHPATDMKESTLYLNFNHKISYKWNATAQFGQLTSRQQGQSFWINKMEADGNSYRSIFIWDAKSIGNYAQAFVNGKATTASISHTILSGIDFTGRKYYADWSQSWVEKKAFNIYKPDYGRSINPNFDRSVKLKDRKNQPYTSQQSTALYVQDEIGAFDNKVRLTLAGRFTTLETTSRKKTTYESKFTPRVGLSVDVLPNTAIYGLFDQSFLPQVGQRFDKKPVMPVVATDIEGGVKKSFFKGKLRATLGAFQITKRNMLVGDPDNPNFSLQLGEVQSKGVEFDVQGEVLPGLNAVLNYANTNVEITKDSDPKKVGTRLAGHARHVNNGWFTYTFAKNSPIKGLGVSLGYQYQINRSSWGIGKNNESLLPDYFRLDGGLFWQQKKYRIQLNINNILNEYLYSGSDGWNVRYWQSEPGINGNLSFTYNF